MKYVSFCYFSFVLLSIQGCGETRFSHTLVYESGQAAVVPMGLNMGKNYSTEEYKMLENDRMRRLLPPAHEVK